MYNAQTIKHSTTEPQTSTHSHIDIFSHILQHLQPIRYKLHICRPPAAHPSLSATHLPTICRPSAAHLPPICRTFPHILTASAPHMSICRPSATTRCRLQPIRRPCAAICRPSAAFCDAAFSLLKTYTFYYAKSTSDAQNASVRRIHKRLVKIAVQNIWFLLSEVDIGRSECERETNSQTPRQHRSSKHLVFTV